jgi:hypothetical protein
MPTTVTTLMARIRRKLEDVQGIHWSDAEVIAAINESKNDLYDLISLRNRDVLPTVTEEYVWSADKMSEHMSVIFNNYEIGTFDILLVSVLPKNENSTADNTPIPLFKKNFEELYRKGSGFSRFYGDFVNEAGNPESWSGGTVTKFSNLFYATQGPKLFIDPVPRSEIRLQFEIVRRFSEFDEAGNNNHFLVFPNEEKPFQRYTRIIEYMSVLILKGRSDESADPVLLQLNQKLTLLNSWLDQQSATGTPTVVVDGY